MNYTLRRYEKLFTGHVGKTVAAVGAAFFAFMFCSSSEGVSSLVEKEAWQTNFYSKIGLKLELPDWKFEVTEHEEMWLLLAYPLVENPVASTQYRVVIAADKHEARKHLMYYPKPSTNTSDWMNSQHLQTSQITNAFWIQARRDVFGTNGFAYFCQATLKRISNAKPDRIKEVGGKEEKLAADMQRILDSIEVLSTNSNSQPSREKVPEILDSRNAESPSNLGQLFNPLTPAEIESIKQGFDQLQPYMTVDEWMTIVKFPKRQYATSVWGPREKQSISMMLRDQQILLLVTDGRGYLIAAQLDEKKWEWKKSKKANKP